MRQGSADHGSNRKPRGSPNRHGSSRFATVLDVFSQSFAHGRSLAAFAISQRSSTRSTFGSSHYWHYLTSLTNTVALPQRLRTRSHFDSSLYLSHPAALWQLSLFRIALGMSPRQARVIGMICPCLDLNLSFAGVAGWASQAMTGGSPPPHSHWARVQNAIAVGISVGRVFKGDDSCRYFTLPPPA